MPALLPRPRMVRYLVARQAGGARHRLRRVEQVGGGVAVGDDELALRRQRREARARLDGELIERQMAGAEGQRRAKLRLPRRQRLAWPRIDQVETDPRPMPLPRRTSRPRLAPPARPASKTRKSRA